MLISEFYQNCGILLNKLNIMQKKNLLIMNLNKNSNMLTLEEKYSITFRVPEVNLN